MDASSSSNRTTFGIYIPEVIRPTRSIRRVFAVSTLAIVLVNAVPILIDTMSKGAYQKWIDVSAPLTDFLSRYVWAPGQMAVFFDEHGWSYRAPVFDNFLLINTTTYLVLLAGVIGAVLTDFTRRGDAIARSINSYLDGKGRRLGGFSGSSFVMWLIVQAVMFTKLGYADHPFTVDAYFVLMALYFWGSIALFLQGIVCLASYLQLKLGGRWSMQAANRNDG